jgi:hypothetical protein
MSDTPPTLFCANHPNVETSLRCKTCEKPICAKCAVRTPTGYSCKDCVNQRQKVFETATWYDYPLAFFIALILSYIGSRLIPNLGFFTIFLAPIAGVGIAEAVRGATRRRRSKRLYQIAGLAAVLGALPMLLQLLYYLILGVSFLSILWSLIWQGLYLFTITSSIYYRLKGIQIK